MNTENALITRAAREQVTSITQAMGKTTSAFWKPVNGSALRFAGGVIAWLFLWWILMFYVMLKIEIWLIIEVALLVAILGVVVAGMIMRPAERRRDRAAITPPSDTPEIQA